MVQARPRVSQVTLCPIHSNQRHASTGIFVHILDMPTPFYGMIVPGSLPGAPMCPAVVREELGKRAEAWILDELVWEAFDRLA